MDVLRLIRRLAVYDIRILQEIEENYAYAIFSVDRFAIGRYRWCNLHLQKNYSFMKVLLDADTLHKHRNYRPA